MKNNRPQHPEQLLHLFHYVLRQPPQPRGDGDGGLHLQQNVSVQVLSLSDTLPQTNWFTPFLSMYFNRVNPSVSSSGSSPSTCATYQALSYTATTEEPTHCLLVISRQVHLPGSKIDVRPTVRN